LWAFNEEVVVRAAAECTIPLISAVGHETDTTLIDYASDQRAPTPTAAAEMAVPVRAELAATLADLGGRSARGWARTHALARERLDSASARLPGLDRLVAPHRQRLDEWDGRLPQALKLSLAHYERRLAQVSAALRPALITQRLSSAQERLDSLWRLATSLDPRRLLARGYAMVSDVSGRVLINADSARAARTLILGFADGDVPVVVSDGGGVSVDASPAPPPAPARKPRPAPPAAPGQASLFD
jgi:exodeoxyribonuclease VII large subunit